MKTGGEKMKMMDREGIEGGKRRGRRRGCRGMSSIGEEGGGKDDGGGIRGKGSGRSGEMCEEVG